MVMIVLCGRWDRPVISGLFGAQMWYSAFFIIAYPPSSPAKWLRENEDYTSLS